MPIKLKVFIQMLQKSQDMHKNSFAFEFNNKNIKEVFGANLTVSNSHNWQILGFKLVQKY